MRRAALGFVVRLAIATAISLGTWFLAVIHFNPLHLRLEVVTALIRVVDFPVAVAGELLYPIRGFEVAFNDGGQWCDFCSPWRFLWLQMRIAIPTYLFLLYLPSLPRPSRRTWTRLAIALAIFATLLLMELVLTGDEYSPLLIGKWLLVFAAAATVAWSQVPPRVKIACGIAVWLAGSWALANLMLWIDRKADSTWPYLPLFLLHVLFVIGGALWLTRVLELRSFSGTSSPYRTSP